MNMTLNINNGRARFSQIQNRNTRANLCKRYFYPASIINDNGSVSMRNFFYNANGTNNSIKKFKKRNIV